MGVRVILLSFFDCPASLSEMRCTHPTPCPPTQPKVHRFWKQDMSPNSYCWCALQDMHACVYMLVSESECV